VSPTVTSCSSDTCFPEAFAAIRATLADFRAECSGWQSEWEALFDDLAGEIGGNDTAQHDGGGDERVLEHLERMQQELKDERRDMRKRQEEMAEEMAALQRLVDRHAASLGSLIQGASPAMSTGPAGS
jgi:hypothetical protein